LYRSDSLTTATRELTRYYFQLMGVGEVMWEEGGTAREEDIFSIEKEYTVIKWEQDSLYTTR
jgi:hypothetical protein